MLEPGITALWQGLVGPACAGAARPALVVDVGVNLGYYSALSAALGCRVVGFEPVPLFLELALLNVGTLNQPAQTVTIFPTVVSNDSAAVSICAPDGSSSVIMGTAGLNGANIGGGGARTCTEHTPVAISDVVDEDVCLLKIDVEGMEPLAVLSAGRLMAAHRVQNIIVEFSPGMAGRPGLPSLEGLVELLRGLDEAGYTAYELDWPLAKTDSLVEADWAAAFEYVQREARRVDAAQFEDFTRVGAKYNTNVWFCRPPRSGSLCGGCPAGRAPGDAGGNVYQPRGFAAPPASRQTADHR